jgi:drug/metabolite transporter superfamily protein YnfA
MNPYWSYLLTAVGVFGLWLAGRKDRRGWMVGIGAQVLWVAYAIATRQWGFLVSAGAYGWVYVKNARSWKPKQTVETVETEQEHDFYGPWHPECRYCGADCSEARSWDGGDLYACPRCAELRAAAHRNGTHRIEGRGKCASSCVHPSHGRNIGGIRPWRSTNPAGGDRFA